MLEDDLKRTVLDMCKHLRLRTAHFRPAKTEKGWRTPVEGDGKGFPDLVIVGTRVLWRELKSEKKGLDEEQRIWFSFLLAAGEDVDVWKPRDLDSKRIERELKAVA